mmetsp:Transcript_50544/g.130524  ORF Transcript_50544/g.130524 Transcript_50544/m.130524 type:complete len:324 (-) Transcript_50544:55-1026(-)
MAQVAYYRGPQQTSASALVALAQPLPPASAAGRQDLSRTAALVDPFADMAPTWVDCAPQDGEVLDRLDPETCRDLYVGVASGRFSDLLPHLSRLPDALVPVLPYLELVTRGEHFPLEKPPQAPSFSWGTSQRRTVVLDLDETLVHCRLENFPPTRPSFSVSFEDTDIIGQVYVRPFARLFLEVTAQLFDVYVFTASSQAYADQVLDQLDPEKRLLSGRLYRQHCTERGGGFLKDLRSLGCPMERAVLVDNSPVSLVLYPSNGILCSSWMGEEDRGEDRELMHLLLLLQDCAQHRSVPEYLQERFRLHAFLEGLLCRPDLQVLD